MASQRGQFGNRCRILVDIASPDRDAGARLDEALGHGKPQTAIAAGNQGDMALKIEKVLHSSYLPAAR